MPVEIRILALGAILLFIHIFVATRFKTLDEAVRQFCRQFK